MKKITFYVYLCNIFLFRKPLLVLTTGKDVDYFLKEKKILKATFELEIQKMLNFITVYYLFLYIFLFKKKPFK